MTGFCFCDVLPFSCAFLCIFQHRKNILSWLKVNSSFYLFRYFLYFQMCSGILKVIQIILEEFNKIFFLCKLYCSATGLCDITIKFKKAE